LWVFFGDQKKFHVQCEVRNSHASNPDKRRCNAWVAVRRSSCLNRTCAMPTPLVVGIQAFPRFIPTGGATIAKRGARDAVPNRTNTPVRIFAQIEGYPRERAAGQMHSYFPLLRHGKEAGAIVSRQRYHASA